MQDSFSHADLLYVLSLPTGQAHPSHTNPGVSSGQETILLQRWVEYVLTVCPLRAKGHLMHSRESGLNVNLLL